MSKFTHDSANYGDNNQTVIVGKKVVDKGYCCNCGNHGQRVGLACGICGGEVSDGTKVIRLTLPQDETN